MNCVLPVSSLVRALAVIALTLSAAACTQTSDKPDKRIRVVSTIFPLADWAAQVGGNHVHVATLLPSGSSPHTFEPSPREMREVSPARVFLRVGLKLDDWGARLAAAGAPGITVLPLGDVLLEKGRLPDIDHVTSGSTGMCTHPPGEEHDHAHDHDSEGVNPHFWLDPVLAAHCVEEIRDVLSDIAPQHAPDFEANASRYLDELDALNRAISENLRHCSPREFVCFHNAFPYLANRYGLHISGIIEEYPGKTPSERYLKELTARLKELGVKTVFAEPQLSRRTADILAAEIGARVEILDPEGMQDAPDRNSYVKLMQYNADRLRRALCGTE